MSFFYDCLPALRASFRARQVQKNLALLASAKQKPPSLLVLASKTHAPDYLLWVKRFSGLHHFGENYLSEARVKIQALKNQGIVWHYIGVLRKRECKEIARTFDWVQSVSRLEEVQRLNEGAQEAGKVLYVTIGVNISCAPSKGGTPPSLEALEVLSRAMEGSCLRLRGLMAIPDPQDTHAPARLRALQTSLEARLNQHLDVCSVGMSGDYEEAVKQGSSMVRIGSLILGKRG